MCGKITVVNKRDCENECVIDISRYGHLGLGNPFRLQSGQAKGSTLPGYRRHLWQLYQAGESKEWQVLHKLAQRVKAGENISLACYCAPGPCHGDIISSAIQWLVKSSS